MDYLQFSIPTDISQFLISDIQEKTAKDTKQIEYCLKAIFTRLSRESIINNLIKLGINVNHNQNLIEKLKTIANYPPYKIEVIELLGGIYNCTITRCLLKNIKSYV